LHGGDRRRAFPGPPLNVLFLAPQPFFEVRGTPLAVLAMVRALAALGHRVDLLTFAQGEDVAIPGVRHLRSLRLPVGRVKPGASLAKLVLDVPFVLEAAARLASRRYDVVHAVEEAAHLVAPLARALRVPLVTDVDSAIPEQLRESGFARRGPLLWMAERMESYAVRNAAAVVTVCDALTDRVRALAPDVPVFQVEDPPLGQDGDAAPAAAVDALRQSLGLQPGPVAFYSGNFEAYQGVELLVDAARLLPDVQVLLMGGEPHEIERLRARGAGTRCVFAGKRPPTELPAFLALADVLVSPRCQGRNTPFKIYTYLASGRPLVATRIETHTQLLDDRLAFLVPPTAEGIADGIRQALADPAEAGRRARAGVQLIDERYSRARYAEKVQRAYATLARP
jgi:glycosyltransferase involved in cell wall biosynthesis